MYDLTVIGAGWAGFNAAREAASRGLKVCLVDNGPLGGTCLNAGCIPAKTLLQSAKLLQKTRGAKDFGISFGDITADLALVQKRKERVVANLRRGMESRLAGIDMVRERAELLDPRRVKAGERVIEAKKLLLCTGSEPRPLHGFAFDGVRILSSDHALALGRVPAKLLIIGGGIIGCEFASLFAAFGSDVTVAEVLPALIAGTDTDMSRKLEASFRKRSITVITGADSSALDVSGFDTIIVSVGRQPRVAGLENAGIRVENGRIAVNEYMETSVDGVYAAGDCTGGMMLAHYAQFQGRIAARNAAGERVPVGNAAIPSCIFTSPEISCVGLSTDAAKKQGIAVKEYKFDFLGSGMAHIMGETEGMIKLLVDAKTDIVAGAFVIGPNACELGGTLTLAVRSAMTARHLRETVFAHPSLTESISEMVR